MCNEITGLKRSLFRVLGEAEMHLRIFEHYLKRYKRYYIALGVFTVLTPLLTYLVTYYLINANDPIWTLIASNTSLFLFVYLDNVMDWKGRTKKLSKMYQKTARIADEAVFLWIEYEEREYEERETGHLFRKKMRSLRGKMSKISTKDAKIIFRVSRKEKNKCQDDGFKTAHEKLGTCSN